MGFTTLGGKSKVIIARQEDGSIDYSFFATGETEIHEGSMVKIKTGGEDGEVENVAAETDEVLGIVTVGTKSIYKESQRVTVKTPFMAIISVIADGSVAYGDKVGQSGMASADPKRPKYKKVTAGAYCGIALTKGENEEEIIVGVLRQPMVAKTGE